MKVQGVLQDVKAQAASRLRRGLISSLAQRMDFVELTIGYHQLEGKIVTLKKPVAMLEKRQPDNMETEDDNQHSLTYEVCRLLLQSSTLVHIASSLRHQRAAVVLQVVGVIRKKCIFKSRPKALISKPTTAS